MHVSKDKINKDASGMVYEVCKINSRETWWEMGKIIV